jgi:hypothetical protein
MTTQLTTCGISRRQLLQATAVGVAGLAPASEALAEALSASEGTVRDRFWIFACAANSDYYTIRRRSLMTPVESAIYFDVPNLLVVQSSENEAPYGRLQPPLAQYTIAMRPLKRVVWSVVGSGGFTSPAETKEVLDLAKTVPNFAGVMLDDFFGVAAKHGVLSVAQLAEVRRQLKQIQQKMEIFVTLYVNQLDLPIRDYLDLIDVITLWTGNPAELVNLEANLKKLETVAPKAKKLLGCYVIDYATKQGIPVAAMQLQCETGLRWLKAGRIDGMIFLGNTVMDLGFESVEWTRQWIRKVGDTKLKGV